MSNEKLTPKETKNVYSNMRNIIIDTQNKIVRIINSAIVESYLKIGERIYEKLSTVSVDKSVNN